MLKDANLYLYASVLAIQHWAEIWQTEAGITPQTCIARREPHYSSTATPLGTTFHIQYRSIQTKVNTVSHTTTQELLKKSPRGVQRGRGFTAPLRFSTASQSKKTRPSAKQESKNKTKNQPHNKQRKRKSQRKIKKKNKRKNKRKNKGEKAWKIWNSFSTS